MLELSLQTVLSPLVYSLLQAMHDEELSVRSSSTDVLCTLIHVTADAHHAGVAQDQSAEVDGSASGRPPLRSASAAADRIFLETGW